MPWQQVHAVSGTQASNPFPIGYTFSKPVLTVRAYSFGALPHWRRAGRLLPIIDIPTVGAARGILRTINLETQLIEFPQLAGLSYTGEFRLFGWIPDVTLTFWEDI